MIGSDGGLFGEESLSSLIGYSIAYGLIVMATFWKMSWCTKIHHRLNLYWWQAISDVISTKACMNAILPIEEI